MGRTRFKKLLLLRGWSQGQAAKELGCSQSWISAMLSGRRQPTLEMACAIRDRSRDLEGGPIEPEQWLERRASRSARRPTASARAAG